MRILFLSTWFPYPPDNGSKIRVYHLLRALAQEHEVTLLSFAFDTAKPDSMDEFHGWCETVQTLPINPFTSNQAGTLQTFLSPRPVASRSVAAMSQLVAKVWHSNKFDIVIASTGMMVDYVRQLPSNTTKVLESHNAMSRWMEERYHQSASQIKRLRYWVSWQKTRRYEDWLFPQFDQVVMVSEQDRQSAQKNLPDNCRPIALVPNGVDCQHNQPGLSAPQNNRLVFNGSLTYHVNFEAMRFFLDEVYPHIKQAVPGVTLTITGSTKGVDLTTLRCDESVQLTGWVEDVRLPVAQASVCVAPLQQGGGTRLKILEAMALGTPVVSTSKGAEGLAVQHGEHLLIADTPKSFAEQVIALLKQPEQRLCLAVQARQLVQTYYDWQQIGTQFVHLMEDTFTSQKSTR